MVRHGDRMTKTQLTGQTFPWPIPSINLYPSSSIALFPISHVLIAFLYHIPHSLFTNNIFIYEISVVKKCIITKSMLLKKNLYIVYLISWFIIQRMNPGHFKASKSNLLIFFIDKISGNWGFTWGKNRTSFNCILL